jgi:organic radical activating enzyme
MQIRYKVIEHERTEDAPFVSSLIASIDCRFSCPGCFNQHLKDMPTLTATAEEIIQEVLSNPFNEGIVLGGLEWTMQKDEAIALVTEAVLKGLKTMFYTGHTTIEGFFNAIGGEDALPRPCLVKVGSYDKTLVGSRMCDVVLASDNQKVYELLP